MISDVFDYERHLKKHRTKILKDKHHKSRQKKQQSTQVLA
jgi:hypothetical protein